MIRPILKDVSSTDWDGCDFADAAECVWFHLEIGAQSQGGADLFQVGFCNQAWANAKGIYLSPPKEEIFLVEPHVFLLEKLTTETIVLKVQSLIDLNGPYSSWQAFGAAMKDYFIWEWAS